MILWLFSFFKYFIILFHSLLSLAWLAYLECIKNEKVFLLSLSKLIKALKPFEETFCTILLQFKLILLSWSCLQYFLDLTKLCCGIWVLKFYLFVCSLSWFIVIYFRNLFVTTMALLVFWLSFTHYWFYLAIWF